MFGTATGEDGALPGVQQPLRAILASIFEVHHPYNHFNAYTSYH